MKTSHQPEIRLPKDPLHQRVADIHLREGIPQVDAYQRVYTNSTRRSAHACCARLFARPDVQTYIQDCRAATAGETVLSIQEKREFFARIVRTPLLKIDPESSTHQDGDLIKKYKCNESETGSHIEFEKHDPLAAIKLDNELAGIDGPSNAVTDLAKALASMKNTD